MINKRLLPMVLFVVGVIVMFYFLGTMVADEKSSQKIEQNQTISK
jgi:hypothetical protein